MRQWGIAADSLDLSVGGLPGCGVRLQYFLYRFKFAVLSFSQHALNYFRNLDETDLFIQKGRNRDFIGSVQCDGLGPARPGSFIGQTQTRKFIHIWGGEVEMT